MPLQTAMGSMLLEQEYRYTYEQPIRDLHHRIIAVPPGHHGRQRRQRWSLETTGAAVRRRDHEDRFGNLVIEIEAAEVERALVFTIRASVAWDLAEPVTLPHTGQLLEELAAPTPLTRANGELREAAARIHAWLTSDADFAEQACEWTARSLVYENGITGIRTTAAEALAGRRGVCQDFSHIMLAVCRAAGVPARYVSGHLVGEGGSHAWVEVLAGNETLAFDPTNDRMADERYLTVAVGRDYSDVPPTSGTFTTGGPGVLSASKRLTLSGQPE